MIIYCATQYSSREAVSYLSKSNIKLVEYALSWKVDYKQLPLSLPLHGELLADLLMLLVTGDVGKSQCTCSIVTLVKVEL